MPGRAYVARGDARQLPLPDTSVDLIVTSPPYFGLRSYTDGGEHYEGQIGSEATPAEFLAALVDCTREWVRVLKPSGSIFVNLGDKYSQRVATRPSSHQDGLFPDRPELRKDWKRDRAAGLARMPYENVINDTGRFVPEKSLIGLPWRYALACIDQLGLILRAEIIWNKPNGLPESVTDRVRRAHEQVFHLVKEPRYYSAVDEIRDEYAPDTAKRYAAGYNPREIGNGHRIGIGLKLGGQQYGQNPLGKLPGSVWSIPSAPLTVPKNLGVDHFAAFPPELPRRLILGWSPPGICAVCGEGRRPVVHACRTIDGAPVENLGAWKRGRGETAGIGNFRFGTDRQLTGYACACTPHTSHRGTRGDWRDGRDVMPTHRSDDWHSPGNAVPRRPGGFGLGGKNPPPAMPEHEYHFDGWTPPPTRPALVVDPFGGTGTTALVASVLGRDAVTVDRSADYCRLAAWRVSDPGERARAAGVPKPPPVPEGQASLFDLNGGPA